MHQELIITLGCMLIIYYTGNADNPLTCIELIRKCTDDKCCGKAFNDAFYHCYSVLLWWNNSRNSTTPVCSDRCTNAMSVLYNDHIGKDLRCCKNGLSEVDQNNLITLKVIERRNNARINLENICKISHTQGCNHDQLLDTFQSKNIFFYI